MFTALALFRLLQEPLRSLPGFVMQLIQAGVSLQRLASFLSVQELKVVMEAEASGRIDIPLSSNLAMESDGSVESCGAMYAEDNEQSSLILDQTPLPTEVRCEAISSFKMRNVVSPGHAGTGEMEGEVVLADVELSWLDDCEHQRVKSTCRICKRAKEKEAREKKRDCEKGNGTEERGRRKRLEDCQERRKRGRGEKKDASPRGGIVSGGISPPPPRAGAEHAGEGAVARERGADEEDGVVRVTGQIRFEAGTLNLVIGRVGSGKSTLLHAVAGQLNWRPLCSPGQV